MKENAERGKLFFLFPFLKACNELSWNETWIEELTYASSIESKSESESESGSDPELELELELEVKSSFEGISEVLLATSPFDSRKNEEKNQGLASFHWTPPSLKPRSDIPGSIHAIPLLSLNFEPLNNMDSSTNTEAEAKTDSTLLSEPLSSLNYIYSLPAPTTESLEAKRHLLADYIECRREEDKVSYRIATQYKEKTKIPDHLLICHEL